MSKVASPSILPRVLDRGARWFARAEAVVHLAGDLLRGLRDEEGLGEPSELVRGVGRVDRACLGGRVERSAAEQRERPVPGDRVARDGSRGRVDGEEELSVMGDFDPARSRLVVGERPLMPN